MSDYLRRDYERVRQQYPDAPLPPYDELTPEQRESHRRSYEQMQTFMDQIAVSVRTGAPLPKLPQGE